MERSSQMVIDANITIDLKTDCANRRLNIQ